MKLFEKDNLRSRIMNLGSPLQKLFFKESDKGYNC